MRIVNFLTITTCACTLLNCQVNTSGSKGSKEGQKDTISKTPKLTDYQVYKQELDLMKKELSDSCKKEISKLSAIEYFESRPYKLSDLDSITLGQFLDYRARQMLPFNRFDYYVFDQIKSMEDAGHCYLARVYSDRKHYAVLIHLYWDCQNSCVLYSFDNKFNIIDQFSLFSYDCTSPEAGDSDYDYTECYYFKNDSSANHKHLLVIDENGKIKKD